MCLPTTRTSLSHLFGGIGPYNGSAPVCAQVRSYFSAVELASGGMRVSRFEETTEVTGVDQEVVECLVVEGVALGEEIVEVIIALEEEAVVVIVEVTSPQAIGVASCPRVDQGGGQGCEEGG